MNYWINVTKDCNLQCTYCYQKDYHQSMYMDQQVADQVVEFILREGDAASAINLFGGEALLNFPMIRYIVERLAVHGKCSFSMTTNLIALTDEMVAFFNHHQFKLLVSLDGNQASQDLGRVTKKGTGTFELVLSQLRKLQDYLQIKVQIAKVLSEDNFANLYQDYLFLKGLGYRVLVNTPMDGVYISEETDFELYRHQVTQVMADYLQSGELDQFPFFHKYYQRYQRLSYSGSFDQHSLENVCTQPENAQLVFDCAGQIHPCHLMVELELGETGLPICRETEPLEQRKKLFCLNPKFKPLTSDEVYAHVEQEIKMKGCNQCRYLHSCLTYFLMSSKTSCILKRYRRRITEIDESKQLFCFPRLFLDVLTELVANPLQGQMGGEEHGSFFA